MFLQIRKDGSKVALPLYCRAGSGLDTDTKLSCDYICKCCLTESGRPVEEYVVERLGTSFSCFYEDIKVVLYLLLAYVFGQRRRGGGRLVARFLFVWLCCDYAVLHIPFLGWWAMPTLRLITHCSFRQDLQRLLDKRLNRNFPVVLAYFPDCLIRLRPRITKIYKCRQCISRY